MFKKIRLRLTLLSGGITTLILIIMTMGYLYISERNLIQNRILSTNNDVYTIASNLEQQTILSYTWLSQLEGGNSYYISVMDNGFPFLFNNRNRNIEIEDFNGLINNVWEYYRENASAMLQSTISYLSWYRNFLYKDAGQSYYCFVITLERDNSVLEMLLIMPLTAISRQIFRQRILFLCIIALALLAIWLFSWFFTGRLLYPIEESRRKQNQFVAAASHELRTPLAVILSCAEAIQENSPSDSDSVSVSVSVSVHNISIIKSEALRMATLIDDMLTLSQRDANRFEIEKSAVELDTLLLDTYEAFETMARENKISISISLPDDALPKCPCDKKRIGQVIAILLHNAISYTPENGSISLCLSMRGDWFLLTVSDTGVGIPDGEKERIFERFYRIEKSRSVKGHFGLGLSIAYEIVSAHNGAIKVSDTPNGGSTFTVSLPL